MYQLVRKKYKIEEILHNNDIYIYVLDKNVEYKDNFVFEGSYMIFNIDDGV